MSVIASVQLSETAAWLDRYNVKYRYVDGLSLDDINMEESQRNQARIGEPINHETVSTYEAAMERGDQFPPIVVYRKTKNSTKYIVIDGNHRVVAAIAVNRLELPAYIVDQPHTAQIFQLTFTANTKHGLPTSREERMHQAVFLAQSGATAKDAARLLNLPERAVTSEVRRQKVIRRLDELDVPGRERLKSTQFASRLAAIRDDTVLESVAKLTAAARLNSNELNDLVTRINAETNVAKQVDVVNAEFEVRAPEIADSGSGTIRMPIPVRRASMALGQIIALDLNSDQWDQMMPEQRNRLAERVLMAADKISALGDKLTRGAEA